MKVRVLVLLALALGVLAWVVRSRSGTPATASPGAPAAAAAPVVEPDTAAVGTADDESSASHLDPNAGWDTDGDATVHGDPGTGLFHTPDSPGFKLGPDGVVFASEKEAEKAGFRRWDQPA